MCPHPKQTWSVGCEELSFRSRWGLHCSTTTSARFWIESFGIKCHMAFWWWISSIRSSSWIRVRLIRKCFKSALHFGNRTWLPLTFLHHLGSSFVLRVEDTYAPIRTGGIDMSGSLSREFLRGFAIALACVWIGGAVRAPKVWAKAWRWRTHWGGDSHHSAVSNRKGLR